MKLKPSDPKYGVLLIAFVLAVIATLLFVLTPDSANLTVAYVFCLLGIALMEGGFLLATAKNVPASYALIRQTGYFLPWSLTVSVIVLALERISLFTLPTIWHVSVQVSLLAVLSIRMIQIFSGAAYVEQLDEQIAEKRNAWGELINHANMLVARAGEAEDKAALKKVADALRYADPLSVAASQEIEERIAILLRKTAGEKCCAICDELLLLIHERNVIVKISK